MTKSFLGKVTIATVVFSALGLGLVLVTASEVRESYPKAAALIIDTKPAVPVSAETYQVIDLKTQSVILSKNATTIAPIASVTKLFAAASFRSQTDLVGSTTITWSDLAAEGRAGKLAYGQQYSYTELVHALLLESSNDAAAVLERVEPNLVSVMNTTSNSAGEGVISFADTSGLSAANQSSAAQLATMTADLYKTQPHLFTITSRPEIIGTHTGWYNNNPFIHMTGYRGGKHGFTYEANRTAVAVFEESVSDTKRDFVYVLLGSDDLVSDIELLREQTVSAVRYE